MTDKKLQIKFSHRYLKQPLYHIKVKLLQVFLCDRKDLTEYFIDYDTAYFSGNETVYYELPNGKLLVLIFAVVKTLALKRASYDIFTTVRRWTPQKEDYYKSNVGEIFNVVVKGD